MADIAREAQAAGGILIWAPLSAALSIASHCPPDAPLRMAVDVPLVRTNVWGRFTHVLRPHMLSSSSSLASPSTERIAQSVAPSIAPSIAPLRRLELSIRIPRYFFPPTAVSEKGGEKRSEKGGEKDGGDDDTAMVECVQLMVVEALVALQAAGCGAVVRAGRAGIAGGEVWRRSGDGGGGDGGGGGDDDLRWGSRGGAVDLRGAGLMGWVELEGGAMCLVDVLADVPGASLEHTVKAHGEVRVAFENGVRARGGGMWGLGGGCVPFTCLHCSRIRSCLTPPRVLARLFAAASPCSVWRTCALCIVFHSPVTHVAHAE